MPSGETPPKEQVELKCLPGKVEMMENGAAIAIVMDGKSLEPEDFKDYVPSPTPILPSPTPIFCDVDNPARTG